MGEKKKIQNTIDDFKKFMNRGNILDLATGIIVGTAFTAIVNSLVKDIIMPLISTAMKFDLTSAKWILREAVIDEATEEVLVTEISLNYGNFIQSLLNFFFIALAVYLTINIIKWIRKGYIRSEIKYIKKLKKKHPEFFDEEDEFGTLLYEKLKAKHPEYFQEEINAEIEKRRHEVLVEPTEIEINNALLTRLNENIEKLIDEKENKDPNTK